MDSAQHSQSQGQCKGRQQLDECAKRLWWIGEIIQNGFSGYGRFFAEMYSTEKVRVAFNKSNITVKHLTLVHQHSPDDAVSIINRFSLSCCTTPM